MNGSHALNISGLKPFMIISRRSFVTLPFRSGDLQKIYVSKTIFVNKLVFNRN